MIISKEEDFYAEPLNLKLMSEEEKNKYFRKYMKNYSKKQYNKSKKNFEDFYRYLLINKKSYAKKKKIAFDLDYNWFIKKYKEGCALTGLKFKFDPDNKIKGAYSPYQVSIDRIDPKKGYIKENCRLILYALNMFKSKWNDEDIYKIAEKLLETRTHP